MHRILILTTAVGGLLLQSACAANQPDGARGPVAEAGNQRADKKAFSDPWFDAGQAALAARMAIKPNTRKARNVILFVADGMDPTTVAAARIFDGQSRGEDGEENLLSFERFPHLAMAKTYTTDAQTPDSAGTMSAMATGVKTKSGVLSVTDAVVRGDCASGLAAVAPTIGELAEQAGMATGVISTARLTHATPAAVFAHAADREWEADRLMSEEDRAAGCIDIARQLIEFPYGDGIDVAMGGGRANFLPTAMADPEDEGRTGGRPDGRNLAEEWTAKSNNHRVVFDKESFDRLDLDAAPRVLGLFERSHMEYEADRPSDAGGEPSLAEMTEAAIKILSKDKAGYLLVVEAGRVDHAHHAGNAARALKDAQAFAQAVEVARAMTKSRDTLIIATADHGHTLTFAGYPTKGNDILGLADTLYEDAPTNDDGAVLAGDGKPYTTLGYANGPGSPFVGEDNAGGGGRPALTPDAVADLDFKQQAIIPARSESHGGQDVTIYADGPHAYLFDGTVEQNYIFHVIDAALDLRRRADRRE
ncbi:MAG: alkaline phosphatase [Pseudomonadota bacterium]